MMTKNKGFNTEISKAHRWAKFLEGMNQKKMFRNLGLEIISHVLLLYSNTSNKTMLLQNQDK